MNMKDSANLQALLVNQASLDGINSFVAEGTTFKGEFTAEEGANAGLKIDGAVNGSIVVNNGGIIHVGPTGRVTGDKIEADYVYVEGSVEAKIVARKGLELTATSLVRGSIEYAGAMNMHSLAKVRAQVSYIGEEDSAHT